MLRPATPLSVLLLAAFVLLLLSVLSVPVTKFVAMGKFRDISFGVFGYCKDGGACSPIGIGYDTGKLLDNEKQAFNLPTSVRDTLSAILVVHPVAAFLTLVMFVMAVVSHLHAPSHSARYLLVLFIFIVITFLVCLLAFLIDILLFIPHLAWGSYVVLTATIMVALSGVVSFAMRRTLVSRKSRRKRIAENAEMSGENYYNREGQSTVGVATSQLMAPMASGGISRGGDNLPTFATFENKRKDDQVSDERIPLTRRSPEEGSPNAMPNGLANAGELPSRDAYGNPVNGPPDAYGMPRGQSADGMSRRGRGEGRGGYGRGGYDNDGAPMRGRGGYGPPGRGGPRGGRAGYGPPPRGAYGMRGGRAPGQYDRNPSADPYYGQPSGGLPDHSFNATNNASMPGYGPNNPDDEFPRAESPPPLAGSGTTRGIGPVDAAPPKLPNTFGRFGQIRDSDVDVAGMVGLQQGRPPGRHDTVMTDGSKYSTDAYDPPRPASPAGLRLPPPAELSGRTMPPVNQPQGGNYYEDVDPRFAGSARPNNHPPPPVEPMYEDVHATVGGSRSPAESERSNFTSISQRGVNPRWNPNPPPMPQYQGVPPRRPVQQQQRRQDMLLDNPDFQLPSNRLHGTPRGGPGMIPGSAYPAGLL
ncbi:pH-response regulator protein palI/RIM9 [Tolypocladium capitatum]|uniref:pH-response regulator protein palI/RIM9 n=1 Tax=Tolypocladium capitatum TaxID=45235 RepID=A0A2K3QCB1_9HYPO|nr:pH-response regulator protein palI/RIM9 [Tolypocladium capitatum]